MRTYGRGRRLIAGAIAALALGACSPGTPQAEGVAVNSTLDPASPATTGVIAAPGATGSASAGASASASASLSASASASASGTASAATAAGGCGRAVAAAPKARITDVKLPNSVIGYGSEGDTEKLPLAIAARPDGTSWLAWMGTNGKVNLGKLGCDDKLTGTPTSFTGIDLQDVAADATGGVLLLTRKGSCGDGPLCGGESSPCNTMHMVRFDNNGKLVWERQVTNLTGGKQGYDDGARFIWWYQHHGRLATDGKNWAAYFGVAITVKNGSCVDVHEGDRMQVVSASGKLVGGHADAFEVGCSHAWTSRIVWDPKTKKFVTVCATDNECRVAQPDPYRTVAAGTCDGSLFNGDVVLAKSKGYWAAWSQGGSVRLEKFTTGKSTSTIKTGASAAHPHLVGYGSGRMLLAWQSGSSMAVQAYDSGTGSTVGAKLTVKVKDHAYQAFKAYSDGSVAYPAAGSTSTSVKVARVLPIN
ncbi:hypothetical protein FB565_000680 [Actinoplanes lutulentus]|uniref:Uncharacterized protein n=1 Tax=Actinoplanes lutulentus TaxID=1287878 RepID=A0A327ZLP5_9ACTN|nr:hypothetical protein [Actinoplanes lutulentus]MBB2940976.1 hypothetical protein [Actinoplanes lutulentus]RAK43285.1 hypothetical protein B0I29_101415 [Actinoplanes lutulentus]